VATADLRQTVDLSWVSRLKHTAFNPNVYGGRVAYLKTPTMHGKVSIFSSGKLISVGSRSPAQAQEDLETVTAILTENNLIKPKKVKANLRNIVAVLDLVGPVDLEELSGCIGGIYEPEQFPGLIFRNPALKVTYLIFSSGKTVIAGARNLNELEQASTSIKELIAEAHRR